jgi:uncharacterized protein YggE
MRFFLVAFTVMADAFSLFAQQPNSVSVTVSSTQASSAGTAAFRVQFVDANLSSTVDTALGVLSSTGIAASNLTGISVAINQGFVVTQYDFTLAVPATQFTTTRDRLIAAQRSLANVNTQGIGWTTAFSLSEEDVSRTFEQALPALLEKARQQAGVLARAISLSVGALQSVSAPAVTHTGLNVAVTLTVTYALM